MDQLFTQPRPTKTWAYLWPCLAIAFLLRVAIGLSPIIYVHPDQVFQYLEPAYRLANGFGFITWEWIYGIRSWLIPFGIAGVIQFADLLGLTHHVFVIIAFSAISMAIPLGVYRLAQIFLPEPQAIAALLIGCFWGYFLHYGSTPMTSMLASCALIWAAVLMMHPPSPLRLIGLGALLTLALAIRFQLIPMIGLLGLFSLYSLRKDFVWVLIGGLGVITAVGVLELFTWGGFLFSFVENFRLNFSEKMSELFGTEPWWFYVWISLLDSGGVFLAMLVGLVLLGRKGWPIWTAVFVALLFYHIPAHKEFRFLTFAMPFGAVGFVHLAFRLMAIGPVLRKFVTVFMPLWIGITSVVYLLFQYEVFDQQRVVTDSHAVMRYLHSAPDVVGVLGRAPQFGWWRTGGYYNLDRAVPVYFSDDGSGTPIPESVSHLVVEQGHSHAGFEEILVQGSLSVLQRVGAVNTSPATTEFDFVIGDSFSDRISTPPVTPQFPGYPVGFP